MLFFIVTNTILCRKFSDWNTFSKCGATFYIFENLKQMEFCATGNGFLRKWNNMQHYDRRFVFTFTSKSDESFSMNQCTRPITSLGHQGAKEFSERGQKFLNYVQ